jgi:hypothetical protein
MPKKILYFDYWTVGIMNFKFIDQYLKSAGYETLLVHLGSWRQRSSKESELLYGIECRDIRYYKTNLIWKVMEREKPDAVVMLNASFITDRSLILCAKRLGIKVIYLMHGALTREEFIPESIKSVNENLKNKKIKRAVKHLRGTVVNYLYSLFKFDKSILFTKHPYKVLWKTFSDPGTYLHFPPPAFDLCPDLALVYTKANQDFYALKFPKAEIVVIGNPDLDNFFQNIDTLGDDRSEFLSQLHISLDKPYVVYIDEGLVEDRIWSNEYRSAFLTQIRDTCVAAGYQLVIKLHPRTARGENRQSIDMLENVTVVDRVNFPKLIYFSHKCISHYSTTLVYPMLLQKPILLPRWGKSREITPLYNPDEVTYCENVEALQAYLKMNDLTYNRENFIAEFAPFKDGKTTNRMVDAIIRAIT